MPYLYPRFVAKTTAITAVSLSIARSTGDLAFDFSGVSGTALTFTTSPTTPLLALTANTANPQRFGRPGGYDTSALLTQFYDDNYDYIYYDMTTGTAGAPIASVTTRIVGGTDNPPPVVLDGGVVSASPTPNASGFSATGAGLHGSSHGYEGMAAFFTSGALRGTKRVITSHTVSGGVHAFAFAVAFAGLMAATDTFDIV